MLPLENRSIYGGTLTHKIRGGSTTVFPNQLRKDIYFESSSVSGDFIRPNPFSFTKDEAFYTYVSGTDTTTMKSDGSVTVNEWNGAAGDSVVDGRQFLPPPGLRSFPGLSSSTYNSALSRIVSKIQDSGPNLAVNAAESPELLKLKGQLGDIASLKRIKKFAAKTPILGAATLMADAWLLWTFALKPTIADAYDLAHFVSTVFPNDLVTARASASGSVPRAYVNDTLNHFHQYREGTYKTKMEVNYSIDDPTLFDLSRLGLLDPASYFWERLPFSFVIDYVFNIGGYLSNLESAYAKGLSFHSGYVTQTYKVKTTREYLQWTDDNSVYYRQSTLSGTTRRENVGCSRSILTSFPSSRVPSLDLDLGSSQLLNVAALLQSILVSRR